MAEASAHGRTATAATETFQSILDAAPDAMIGVNADGRIVMANAQAESVFGYRKDDLLGLPLRTLIPEGARGLHDRHHADFFSRPRHRPLASGLDLAALRSDGTEFPVEISLSLLDTDEGVIALAAIRDITDRRRVEDETRRAHEEARQAADELQIAYRELQAFSYAVAHDLRAPLRAIDGFSEALVEEELARLDEPGRAYLDRIRRNVRRMATMIDALLDLSRLVRSTLDAGEVDLSALVSDAIEAQRESDPGRSVTAIVQPGVTAAGDRGLLPLLVQNLVSNAWKFTSSNGRATIEFGVHAVEGDRVYFVRDDGVGFDPRHAERLFHPFQRLHTDDVGGSGIGLATAERIVRRHGGRIWAEGEVGAGATFSFTLGERMG